MSGNEDVLTTGAEPLSPPPGLSVVVETTTLLSVSLRHLGSLYIPSLMMRQLFSDQIFFIPPFSTCLRQRVSHLTSVCCGDSQSTFSLWCLTLDTASLLESLTSDEPLALQQQWIINKNEAEILHLNLHVVVSVGSSNITARVTAVLFLMFDHQHAACSAGDCR